MARKVNEAMNGLYEDAELYDLVAPRDEAMERFYVEATGGAARSVLELACGSGRVALPLAESGARVTAGDLSKTMLEQARTAAKRDGSRVEFLELDMRDFDLGRQFDAIVVAANSLMHLLTAEDLGGTFDAIRRHLAPNGVLAFDVFVPNARLLSQPPGTRQRLGTFQHPRLGSVLIDEEIVYDPVSQISQADWFWSTQSAPAFRHTTISMRQIYPQELLLLLRRSGLEPISRFGDFDRRPLTAESWRQICLCRPLGSSARPRA
ncbi:class I SAM-dependent methyltransferase [Devosia sp.]|uniref:class I SAM-dependent methyltransferase n=1 Tax=Devosia sp. TaxID=1871048 RepID=UPI001AC36995|nr:class I SAM-dependent methyltransferase [Devosia sp.]MBN9334456.1 class I SAM-dependent methyltransferase [Devosia sp.]